MLDLDFALDTIALPPPLLTTSHHHWKAGEKLFSHVFSCFLPVVGLDVMTQSDVGDC